MHLTVSEYIDSKITRDAVISEMRLLTRKYGITAGKSLLVLVMLC